MRSLLVASTASPPGSHGQMRWCRSRAASTRHAAPNQLALTPPRPLRRFLAAHASSSAGGRERVRDRGCDEVREASSALELLSAESPEAVVERALAVARPGNARDGG